VQIDDEALFREFLVEVQALDDFRNDYKLRYDFEALGREDQDVQRLIEAMAFYCARTRGGVERAMHRYKLRALEQLFPHLLSPMPAMALLYPMLTSNMTETRCLPALAEVSVVTSQDPKASLATSEEGAPRAHVFRCLNDIQVLPLYIVERSARIEKQTASALQGDASRQQGTGYRLTFRVAASPAGGSSRRHYDDVKRPLQELALYLNPQGDVLLALRTFDAIRESCRQVTARFYSEGGERSRSMTQRLRFGMPPPTAQQGWENPIAHARRSIHFPLADLCIGIPLAGAPAEWDELELELTLDERWPSALAIVDQTFLLNAGPIENLVRRSAEPTVCDGTRLRHRIEPQEPMSGLKVREVLGVFRGDPALPGARSALPGNPSSGEGYTLDVEGRGPERETWIETDAVLGSVTAPEKLYVDAEWYVPSRHLPNPREASVSVEAYDLGPLTWRVSDPLRSPAESSIAGDPKALDRLLELHGRRVNCVADLLLLFQVLGVADNDMLARIPRYIAELRATFTPDSRTPAGGVRAYDVTLSKLPLVLVPAARFLFRLLPGILGTWTGDLDVRVGVGFDESVHASPMVFEWRASSDA
jgi:type VI secretion system protein ImpG